MTIPLEPEPQTAPVEADRPGRRSGKMRRLLVVMVLGLVVLAAGWGHGWLAHPCDSLR